MIPDSKLNIFQVVNKTWHLKTSPWALGNIDQYFMDQTTNILIEKIINNVVASCVCLFTGLYGNDGLLPARRQLRYSGKPLLEQLQSSPTLLWLGPQLGLDTHTAIELLCLLGAALSLAATLVEALRDSVVFLCLWALYLSMYQVRVQ